jgi:hypothetical protein
MTREDQIKAASQNLKISASRADKGMLCREAFELGVEWADNNPKSPWISVEEKLPPQKGKDHPYSELVFVRYIERLIDQEYVRYSFDELLCIGKIKKWCRHQNNNEHVTHWMPIPELPKEE